MGRQREKTAGLQRLLHMTDTLGFPPRCSGIVDGCTPAAASTLGTATRCGVSGGIIMTSAASRQ